MVTTISEIDETNVAKETLYSLMNEDGLRNDKEFINSLMVQVTEVNKTAGWIVAPNRGINNMDIGYEYVNLKK